ncbi:MAG: DUF3107 domain-containing protein [Acidimicrobiales bacterium]
MDVRIGIIHSVRELDIDLPEGTKHDKIVADVEKALAQPDGVLWLADKRGREYAVATAKIAYVEIGDAGQDRRVGFGTS